MKSQACSGQTDIEIDVSSQTYQQFNGELKGASHEEGYIVPSFHRGRAMMGRGGCALLAVAFVVIAAAGRLPIPRDGTMPWEALQDRAGSVPSGEEQSNLRLNLSPAAVEATVAATAVTAATVASRKIRIVAIGDCITFGSCTVDPLTDAWPAILGARLGDGYEVKNLGVAGTRLTPCYDQDGRRHHHFPFTNTSEWHQFLRTKPDIVTIQLGSNDILDCYPNFSSELFKASYHEMIEDILALSDPPPVVIPMTTTPQYCHDSPDPVTNAEWLYNRVHINNWMPQLIKGIANEHGLTNVDLYGAFGGAGMDHGHHLGHFANASASNDWICDSDCGHWNNLGHEHGATTIERHVREIVAGS